MNSGEAGEGSKRPAKDALGAPRVAPVSAFLRQLHDLTLNDHKQQSRDLEIQLKEAELAVQMQQRLKVEEEVRPGALGQCTLVTVHLRFSTGVVRSCLTALFTYIMLATQ